MPDQGLTTEAERLAVTGGSKGTAGAAHACCTQPGTLSAGFVTALGFSQRARTCAEAELERRSEGNDHATAAGDEAAAQARQPPRPVLARQQPPCAVQPSLRGLLSQA